jgi:hypothetical protein
LPRSSPPGSTSLSKAIRIRRMFQYGVDDFMDGSAIHYLVLAQFFIHP